MFLPLSIGTSSKRISGVPVIYEFQIAEVVLAFPEDRGSVCISQEEEMFQGCISCSWISAWFVLLSLMPLIQNFWHSYSASLLDGLTSFLSRVSCRLWLFSYRCFDKASLFPLLILNSSGDWGSSWSECAGTKTDTTPLSCSGQWNSYLPCSRS